MMNKKEKIILFSILGLALVLRIAGVGYGLPLFLNDDEPPFPYSALKMIQLKTLLPALHLDEFRPILFYTPYLAYLYLPFYVLYMAVAGGYFLLLAGGNAGELANYFLSDLSPFFLIARIISAGFGVGAVYFVYAATKNIFSNHQGKIAMQSLAMTEGMWSPVVAGFLLATSLMHSALSMTARHWGPVAFFIALGLCVLSRADWPVEKRYLWVAITAGIGFGFNVISATLLVLAGLFYFFLDKVALRRAQGLIIKGALIFIVLAVIPILLYPAALGFGGDVTAASPKTFLGAPTSAYDFLKPIIVSEPIFAGLALIGLIFTFFKKREIFWTFGLFIIFYSLIFYMFFRYEHRFVAGLLPILAILGGYGASVVLSFIETLRIKYGKIAAQSLAMTWWVALLAPLIFSARLSFLALRGDAKSLAREWLEVNVPAGEKVIVAAKRTRVSTTKKALAEQEKIDSSSIRKMESAEVSFAENPHNYKSFHALNLDAVGSEDFYKNIGEYIKKEGYKYLLVTPGDLPAERAVAFYEATRGVELVAFWGNNPEIYSVAKSEFMGNSWGLFAIKEMGARTAIYRLK